jgi:hypothetical protein
MGEHGILPDPDTSRKTGSSANRLNTLFDICDSYPLDEKTCMAEQDGIR